MTLQYPLTPEEIAEVPEWYPMDQFPIDGTRCLVKFKEGNVQPGLFWGYAPLGKTMVIRGDENVLSPYLVPVAWAKQTKEYKR